MTSSWRRKMTMGGFRFSPDSLRLCLPISLLMLNGCDGPQSTLTPAGRGAEQINTLFWWMLGGGLVTWCVVVGLALYAIRISPQPHDPWRSRLWIIGGGAIVPTIVLTILLVYGLSLLPGLVKPAPLGSLQINVTAAQWWWRVQYPSSVDHSVELANEIRLPVDEPVQFHLESMDVIHAFWIPSIGGKVDTIPGRKTRLTLEPTKVGTYRGVCAEYCGSSHALMAFDVVVMPREEFAAWLEQQQLDATAPRETLAREGQEVFLSRGCGGCHTIRGTAADGVIGPDLTHVGSRKSLAAGILSNDVESFQDWIVHPSSIKPGAQMPDFDTLSKEELSALSAYLKGLQ